MQRAQQPNAGRWGFPGGVLELGETVGEGAMRELLEETGVVAEPAGPSTCMTRSAATPKAGCSSTTC